MKKLFFGFAMTAAAIPCMAHTYLINEQFNSPVWPETFTRLELDHLAPAPGINPMFTNSQGVAQPWAIAKDASASTDRYLISHSYYTKPATSNDWLSTIPVTIPSDGFTLIFGAQSVPIRGGEHAYSDLDVFVTEQPVTKEWQPTESVMHIADVPYGKSVEAVEGDFTTYELNLDAYKGKTIYISFANLNTDKDILALDDIMIRRLDYAEVVTEAPEYIVAGDYTVKTTIKGTSAEGLNNWKLTFKSGDTEFTHTGARLAEGDELTYDFTATAIGNKENEYTLTLSSDNAPDIVETGIVTGLLFQTTKRVLIEETTGTWCGNCTAAMYSMETVENHEEFDGLILPVSIHVGNDPMVVDEYEYMFGLGATAPFMRPDRQDELFGVTSIDSNPDPYNPLSCSAAIVRHLNDVALGDVTVSGTYLKNAGKISAIDATAEFTPAIDLDGEYAIGFILTENNVKPEKMSNAWIQTNYLDGDADGQAAGNPYASLPHSILNMVYQDVARQIYGFRGMENSLPSTPLKGGETYKFNTQLTMPTAPLGNINSENCYLTAFVIEQNKSICTVLNSARVALGENPAAKIKAQDILDEYIAGVDGIEADFTGEPEYYNMQGVKVVNPGEGIYIVRRGNTVTKEVVR